MTAFFSTGEFYTASTSLGAVVAFTPALIVMHASMQAVAGKTARISRIMTMASPLKGVGGARLPWGSTMGALPSLKGLGGKRVPISLTATMTVTLVRVAAGGMAGLLTDLMTTTVLSTAMFSTAGPLGVAAVVRTQHSMTMLSKMNGKGGATPKLNIVNTMQGNRHGPIARSKGVQGQLIMS